MPGLTLAGEKNPTLILTTYGHLMPGNEDGMRQAMEDAWQEASAFRVPAVGSAEE